MKILTEYSRQIFNGDFPPENFNLTIVKLKTRGFGKHPAGGNSALIFWSLICLAAVFAENNMTSRAAEKPKNFYQALDRALRNRRSKLENLCDKNDAVAHRILEEYGSIFVARKIHYPPVCMFTGEAEVQEFQAAAKFSQAEIEGVTIELQPKAMKALLKARAAAQKEDLGITPRGGAEAARRSFADTLRLWKSRFEPASAFWLKEGRLTAEQVAHLKSLPLKEQVGAVLELEKQGIFFNTRFDNSILYSVAAPGTSQHLAMLALDVVEFENVRVREILAEHGWFRTVQNDEPHFTYLGRKEKNLEKHGLTKIETNNGEFWIPNV